MRSLQSLAAQTYLRGHDDLAKCRLALDVSTIALLLFNDVSIDCRID